VIQIEQDVQAAMKQTEADRQQKRAELKKAHKKLLALAK